MEGLSMIRRISNRAMWTIWSAVLLVSIYGIAQLEHATKEAASAYQSVSGTTLHAYFDITAEAMWVIGLVSALAAIVLIGYMGSICSNAFKIATDMQLEAMDAIQSKRKGNNTDDASQR
jgi:hypothetical protein